MTPVSLFSPPPIDFGPASQPLPDSNASGQSFSSYFKSSTEASDESNNDLFAATSSTNRAGSHPDRNGRQERVQRRDRNNDPTASTAPHPAKQIEDSRSISLSIQKKDGTQGASNESDPGAAFKKLANPAGAEQASAHALQKTQIAFSVTLPKMGSVNHASATMADKVSPAAVEKDSEMKNRSGKQREDASDSNAPAPAPKLESLPSGAKDQQVFSLAPSQSVPAFVTAPSQESSTAYESSQSFSPPVTTTPSASEVMNTADLPATAPTRTPQSIDLKLSIDQENQLDVRVSQRAGDVQVTVRTADSDLAQSLRQHLPELSDKLSQSGVHGEIWHPTAAASESSGSHNQHSDRSNDHESQSQGRASQNQEGRSQQRQQQRNNQSVWSEQLTQAEKEGPYHV